MRSNTARSLLLLLAILGLMFGVVATFNAEPMTSTQVIGGALLVIGGVALVAWLAVEALTED